MAGGFFGPFGNSLAAASGDELRDLLEQVDTTVPRRSRGRRSEHIERYCVVHYLRTLERNGRLRFPFRIAKNDPPDFVVEMGLERFGLEVTTAGHPEHQRALTRLEKSPRGSVVVGRSVREPGQPFGAWAAPYVGDEPERFWTEEVLARIKDKTERLAAYASLPEEDLLVYDNTEYGPLTDWTVTELPSRLATAIQEWRTGEPERRRHFRHISVLRDRVLIYDVTGDAFLLPVPPSPTLPALLPLTRLGVSEEDLRAFCRQHYIRKLGFFGSVREAERFRPDSDVDVLVEFEPSHRIGLMGLAGVELELSELLKRKADLRTVPDLSRYFREEVVREKTDLAYVAG